MIRQYPLTLHFKSLIVTLVCLGIFGLPTQLKAQQLSEQAEVSVITIAPGQLLLDTFGHSAFRVVDKVNSIDKAYNYGVYDFNTPNFYGKFAQGKLLYQLDVRPFSQFARLYAAEGRTIKEQILNLSQEDKQAFFNFLEINAQPDNRSYLYDFFFDNCATRMRSVGKNVLQDKLDFSYSFTEGKNKTFRDLIHDYAGMHKWGTFGIDLALGAVIDRKASAEEYTFLPDYIHAAFAESTLNGKPIVKEDRILFKAETKESTKEFWTPLLVFSLLCIMVILITLYDLKRGKRTKVLDFCLFFISGLIGLLMLLLWFATDHSATANNFNVLWAFAPNLIVALFLLKSKRSPWIKPYVWLLIGLIDVLIVLWIIQVQIFPAGLIPILLMFGIRYLYLVFGKD